jgi:hypothetical protein
MYRVTSRFELWPSERFLIALWFWHSTWTPGG